MPDRKHAPRHLDDAHLPAPPADSLGLLGDLAAEAAAERAALQAVRGERADAAAEARRRDEALRREALQAELVEETRRRNASRLLTSPEVKTQRRDAKVSPVAVLEPAAAPPRASRWLMAASFLLLAGGGGAAIALTQTPLDGIQVDGLASRASEIGATVVAASMTARESVLAAKPAPAEAVAPAETEVGAEAPVAAEATPGGGGDDAPKSEAATVKKPTAHRPTTKPPTKPPAITTDFGKIYGGGKTK